MRARRRLAEWTPPILGWQYRIYWRGHDASDYADTLDPTEFTHTSYVLWVMGRQYRDPKLSKVGDSWTVFLTAGKTQITGKATTLPRAIQLGLR